jgi:hypothetical protein
MIRALYCLALIAACLCLATTSYAASTSQAQDLLSKAQASLQAGRAPQALKQTEAALEAIWQQVPLKIERVLFLKNRPQAYGVYTARPDNRYPTEGQPVLIYLEPVGYRVKTNPDGSKTFGVSLDIALTDTKGKVLWGKEGFLHKELTSRHFIKEFYLLVTLTLSSAPAGDYFVSLRVNDLQANQSAAARLPLQLR